MLKVHKHAIAEIKSAQQRVEKATEERDKLKGKLKKAQARLAAEKQRLRKNQRSWKARVDVCLANCNFASHSAYNHCGPQ